MTRQIATTTIDAAMAASAIASITLSSYLALISVAGLRPPKRRASQRPSTTFAIFVPAHDEAASIAETLTSLDLLDYPAALFEVHVVADNCTDDTADVVRQSGRRVHERHDPVHPGKGPALNWLFDQLVEQGADFEAVAIVDADTTVEPGFLRAMDAALAGGATVAQGYYSVRDPDASPAMAFRYAALACRHHLRALGRCRLGGSCGLYGNGMVFRRPVLVSRRWSSHLVEDAELQNELLLDGIIVTYVHDAVVRAEMPATNEAATSQNQRWERGRIELVRRYVPRLAARALRRRSHRFAHVDAVLDHLVPPLSVLLAFELAAATTAVSGAVVRRRGARLAFGVDLLAILAVAGHVLAGLYSVRSPVRYYRALAGAPRIAAWKVGIWAGVAADGDVAWTRTRRNVERSTGATP